MEPRPPDRGIYAPKGQEILAQGFNPGLIVSKGRALKVAPDSGWLVPQTITRDFASSHPIWCPFSTSNPAVAGCNSNKAIMNDCLVRAGSF